MKQEKGSPKIFSLKFPFYIVWFWSDVCGREHIMTVHFLYRYLGMRLCYERNLIQLHMLCTAHVSTVTLIYHYHKSSFRRNEEGNPWPLQVLSGQYCLLSMGNNRNMVIPVCRVYWLFIIFLHNAKLQSTYRDSNQFLFHSSFEYWNSTKRTNDFLCSENILLKIYKERNSIQNSKCIHLRIMYECHSLPFSFLGRSLLINVCIRNMYPYMYE